MAFQERNGCEHEQIVPSDRLLRTWLILLSRRKIRLVMQKLCTNEGMCTPKAPLSVSYLSKLYIFFRFTY
jgi:hypothetical protein